ncbi:MAG: hypothetical protein COA32_13715 [Fluviicola sp.]|nr:MAG: hypothetical protein COA32_13715 [Fluviicola sp.]
MTDKEKQEIKEVVNNYGVIRHKYWDDLTEIQRMKRDGEIYLHIGELRILKLHKQLKESDERSKFVKMAKEFDNKDDDFKKYFQSACLREFNDIHIAPDKL